MTTYTKNKLSGSTNGKGIKVAQTATPGTLIHTAVSGTDNWDEIWIYAVNTSISEVKLTLEWGGAAAPDDNIESTIPAEQGLFLVVPGLLLQNSLTMKAFAAVPDVLVLHGFINEITT